MVVAALKNELSGFVRSKGLRRTDSPAGMLAWSAYGVLAVAGGMGDLRAAAAAEWALRSGKPTLVISAGFAGGCVDGQRPGDIVIGSDICWLHLAEQRDYGRDTQPFACPPELVKASMSTSQRLGLRSFAGTVVSSPAPLNSIVKRRLGETVGALAVDMEACAVAQVANASATPFMSVKSVVDPVGEDLPGFIVRTGDGPEPRVGPVLRHLLRQPWELGSVLHLARSSSTASASLGKLIAAIADDADHFGRAAGRHASP